MARVTSPSVELRPAGAAATTGFSSTPQGPIRAAALSDETGVIGMVWADSGNAAGYVPKPGSVAGVQATGYVWTVARQLAAKKAKAAAVVDEAARYSPLYTLGQPRQFRDLAAARKALLT
jgi:hypothetical protein